MPIRPVFIVFAMRDFVHTAHSYSNCRLVLLVFWANVGGRGSWKDKESKQGSVIFS